MSDEDTAPRQRRKGAEQPTSWKPESSQKPAKGQRASAGPGLFSIVGALLALLFSMLVIALIVLPSPIEPTFFRLPSPPPWTGPMEINNRLQQTQLIYVGLAKGAESLAYKDGALYSGTTDGKIVKLGPGEETVTTIARLGRPPCGQPEYEPNCGRVLGVRFEKIKGHLIVADAYLGLFEVDVDTGSSRLLVNAMKPMEGQRPMAFVNDLDVDDSGVVYFTDSSSKWQRRHNRLLVTESSQDSRLFSYDLKTGETKLLLDGRPFANGVQLSPNQDFLLFTETSRAAVFKYHLKGAKRSQVEVFNDNLPGTPDNIRPSGRGGYWIGIAGTRGKPGTISFLDFVGPRPWIRRLMFKLFSQEIIMKLVPKHGLIIRLDEEGQIVESLHDPGAKVVPSVSEVLEVNNTLYLGSYHSPFVGKLTLD